MTGWKLEDTNGNIFVFPELTLYKDESDQYPHIRQGSIL